MLTLLFQSCPAPKSCSLPLSKHRSSLVSCQTVPALAAQLSSAATGFLEIRTHKSVAGFHVEKVGGLFCLFCLSKEQIFFGAHGPRSKQAADPALRPVLLNKIWTTALGRNAGTFLHDVKGRQIMEEWLKTGEEHTGGLQVLEVSSFLARCRHWLRLTLPAREPHKTESAKYST